MDELETEAAIKRDRERLTQAREEAEQRIQAAEQELADIERYWYAPAHERPPGGESFADVVWASGRQIDVYEGRALVGRTKTGRSRLQNAYPLGCCPAPATSSLGTAPTIRGHVARSRRI